MTVRFNAFDCSRMLAEVPPVISRDYTDGALLVLIRVDVLMEGPGLRFEWRRDGVAISGANGSIYKLVDEDRRHMLHCVVYPQATDGEALYGLSASSNSLYIGA